MFIGGLLASTTIETVKEYFTKFGAVLDAQVMVDKESSRSKGFGFVTFSNDEACEKVVSIGMVEIDGKQVSSSSCSMFKSFRLLRSLSSLC